MKTTFWKWRRPFENEDDQFHLPFRDVGQSLRVVGLLGRVGPVGQRGRVGNLVAGGQAASLAASDLGTDGRWTEEGGGGEGEWKATFSILLLLTH